MTVTLESLNEEYTKLCTTYGDLSLRIEAMTKQSQAIKLRVDELTRLQQDLIKANETQVNATPE